MIPVWTESSSGLGFLSKLVEKCVFCAEPTRTWHENTNSPICITCAGKHKVSEIPEDHGSLIRKEKREGAFDRGDSKRAN